MKQKNRLVVFEGIDGVGKTTMSLELKKFLKQKGISAILYEDYESKNPSFNVLKPLVKKIPISGSHFFYLASSVYKSEVIKKLLKKHWVICDRYFYSTNAYHLALGSNLKINTFSDILKPDFAFLLTVKEGLRQMRIKQKLHITKKDRIPKKNKSLPQKMENIFKKMDLIHIDNSVPKEEALKRVISYIYKK